MKAPVGTLVLLLIAGALGAAFWWGNRKAPATQGLMHPLLGGKHLQDAVRIKIQNDVEGLPIVLVRDGARYRMEEPMRDLASQAFVDSVARGYDSAQLLQVFAGAEITPKVLADTGLDKPRCRLELRFDDADAQVIELGLEGVTSQDLFVKKNDVIWRGDLGLYTALRATVTDMRERLVWRTEFRELKRIAITRTLGAKQERFVLQLEGGDPWIVEPVRTRPEVGAAGGLIQQVLGMRADTFLHGAVGPRPGADYTIEVEGAYGAETVQLWTQERGAITGQQKPRDLDFTMQGQRLEQALRTPVDELRARIVLPVKPEDIRSIALDPGAGKGKPVRLQPDQVSGDLRLVEPVSSPTDPTVRADLLRALGSLSAERFVDEVPDLASVGLAQDAFRVEVGGPTLQRPIVVLLGKDEGELTWCTRQDERLVVLVKKSLADILRADWAPLVEKEVQKVNGAPQRLELTRGARSVRYAKAADGKWREEGKSAPPAGIDVEEVVGVLVDLKAKRVLDPARAGELGEATRVKLETGNGDTLAALELFPRDNTALARTARIAVVYELAGIDARNILELLR